MNNSIIVPIKAFPYQTATHCQSTDCWHRPIAGPTNWNRLQQQAVSWDSWQRYEGLDWASPVQWGPAGEEGWVLHHWSRVTVMDRFREGSWWPRFFSVWTVFEKMDMTVARLRSPTGHVCLSACVCGGYMCMSACSRVLMWVCMRVKQSSRAINVKSDTGIWDQKLAHVQL